MVLLFAGLALLDLGFCVWRRNRVFWSVGLVCGLTAAILPIREGNAVSAVVLQALIVVPCAGVATWLRWPTNALALAAASLMASTTSLMWAGREHSWPLVTASSLLALVSLAAAIRADETREARDRGRAAGLLLLWAAVLPFVLVERGVSLTGTLGTYVLAVLAMGVAAIRPLSSIARSLQGTAVAIALLLAPVGLTAVQALFVYGLSGIAVVELARRPEWRAFGLRVASGTLSLGLGALLLIPRPGIGEGVETLGLIVLLTLCALIGIRSGGSPEGAEEARPPVLNPESTLVTLGVVATGLLVRASNLWLGGSGLGPIGSGSVGLTVGALVVGVIGARQGWLGPTALAVVGSFLAHAVLFLQHSSTPSAWPVLAVANFVLAVAVWIAPTALERARPGSLDGSIAPAFLVSSMGALAGMALVLHHSFGLIAPGAFLVSSLVYAAIVTATGAVRPFRYLTETASVYLVVCAMGYSALFSPGRQRPGPPFELGALAGVFTVVLMLALLHARRSPESSLSTVSMAGFVLGVVAGRAAFLSMTVGGLHPDAALISTGVFLAAAYAALSSARGWPSLAWYAGIAYAPAYLGTLLVRYPVAEAWPAAVVRGFPWSVGVAVFVGLIGSGLVVARAASRAGARRGSVVHTVVPALWVPVSGLLVDLLRHPPIGMATVGSVTLSWTLYGALLLAYGFRRAEATVRFWGLLVLYASALKILLYDLAVLELTLRASVSLVLSVVLLAGQYLYILAERSLASRPEGDELPLKASGQCLRVDPWGVVDGSRTVNFALA